MYLESLLRLAEVVDHYNSKNTHVVNKDFHEKTVELIDKQTKFLIEELQFRQDNPGPYNFGFGDLVITLYSPEETGVQEWAALARKGTWQKTYRFNSVMGLVKVFSLCINDAASENSPEKETKEETKED